MMNARQQQIAIFALNYLMANLDDAMADLDEDTELSIGKLTIEEVDNAHSAVSVSNEMLAACIASKLFWITGINQKATLLVPTINQTGLGISKFEAGGYTSSEFQREIVSVLSQ
jgi:hypothetical protein